MTCQTCGGTGFVPHMVDGRPSRYAKQHCPDCYDAYRAAAGRPPVPSDYDYPMSWSTWRSICRQNGWKDPGSDTLEPTFERITSSTPSVTMGQFKMLKAEIAHLRNRLNDKKDSPLPPQQPRVAERPDWR